MDNMELTQSVFHLISPYRGGIISVQYKVRERGGMADALGSGPSGCKPVEVQLLSLAPFEARVSGLVINRKPFFIFAVCL